jgi:hypothetical protein
MAAGQGELDLGLDDGPEAGGPLEITGSRMGHLWEALSLTYDVLGFDQAAKGDEVFRQLVLARPSAASTSPRFVDHCPICRTRPRSSSATTNDMAQQTRPVCQYRDRVQYSSAERGRVSGRGASGRCGRRPPGEWAMAWGLASAAAVRGG